MFAFENYIIHDKSTRKRIGSAKVSEGLYVLSDVNLPVDDSKTEHVFSSFCNKDKI